MEHEIEKVWNQKDDWFYDRAQADRVRAVIVDRLADDRIQDECRYLVRLRWHFIMGYQEVSYSELQEHVSPEKMLVLNELFTHIVNSDYAAIEEWVQRCERELPPIEDNWAIQHRDDESAI